MTAPWQLLIVEDSEDDYLLLTATLRRQGFNAQTERVQTPEALTAALGSQAWDAVISDFNLPHFSAPAALDMVKSTDPDLPFIIVSGVVGEEAAVSAMRAGAHDFINKNNLARLGVSIAREIGDADQRRARRTAEAEQNILSARLDRAQAESELLNVIVSTAAGQDDLEQMLTNALEQLRGLISFTGGSIALVEQNYLTIHAAYGPFAAQALGQRLPRSAGVRSWRVIDSGRYFISGDVVAQGFRPTTPIRSYLAVPLTWRGRTFGLLEIDSTTPNAFTAADLSLTQKVAARLSGPVELAHRVKAERAAREAEQIATERVRRLHRLGAALAGALLPEHVAEVAIEQGLEATGASAGLFWRVAAEPARLEVVRLINFSEAVRRLAEHQPLDLEAPGPEAVRTGQAVWLESAAAQAARFPNRAEAARTTGYEAWAFLPLQVDGPVLGVMLFSFTQAHVFTPDEQAFLLALARQCAQALERARLYAAEQAARQAAELAVDRTTRLQTLTAALSQAVTPEAVMETALREGAAALDTAAAALNLISADGQWLETVRHLGYDEATVRAHRRQPLTAALPGTDVARTGQPLWLGTSADWPARYAEYLAQSERDRQRFPALAVLPLHLSGRLAGAMAFGFTSPRRFEAADQHFVTAIVAQCGQALDLAQLYAAEREAAANAQLLARASALLATAPAAETAAGAIAGLVAPEHVDFCRIELDGNSHSVPDLLADETESLAGLWLRAGQRLRGGAASFIVNDLSGEDPAPCVQGQAMCGYLAVPLAARGQVLGVMVWASTARSNRGLESKHVALAEVVAHRLALALDNARLYAELEARVVERTAALQREIAERRAAEVELEHSRDLLRDLSARLQAVREEERTRIAYRIHDDLGQQLAGMKMDLAWLTRQVQRAAPTAPVRDKLVAMADLVDSMVATVRLITTELRPGLLDDFGLPAALEWQVQEFQQRTGILAEFRGAGEVQLDSERATALFRIVQEALNNVAWHAQATRVIVRLDLPDKQVRLEIDDNGQGITPETIASPKSLGLVGMGERARRLGGKLEIANRPGGGTQVNVQVPLKQP